LSESSSVAQPENLRLLKNLKNPEYYESAFPDAELTPPANAGEFQLRPASQMRIPDPLFETEGTIQTPQFLAAQKAKELKIARRLASLPDPISRPPWREALRDAAGALLRESYFAKSTSPGRRQICGMRAPFANSTAASVSLLICAYAKNPCWRVS